MKSQSKKFFDIREGLIFKKLLLLLIVLLFFPLLPSLLCNAQTSIDPPVRRALPVDAFPAMQVLPETDASLDTAPSPIPIAPAVARLPAAPSTDPQEIRRAEPAKEAVLTFPEQSALSAKPSSTPASSSVSPTANLRPVTPDPTPLPNPKETADAAYARKLYDLAIAEYERFLSSPAQPDGRDAAFFRLAESYRALNKNSAARENYEALLSEFQHGEFASAGAYRLGELLFEDKQYEVAAEKFALAAKEAHNPSVASSALYLTARALQNAEKPAEALAYYEKVIAANENPYHPFALLAAADIALSQENIDKALSWYQEAAASTKSEINAKAALQAATILFRRNQLVEARPFFLRARAQAKDDQWRALAELGLIELDYREKNYEALTKLSEAQLVQVPAQSHARAFLIAANANRFRQQHNKALKFYDRILRDWPTSESANEAAFERLICLYNIKDKNLLAEIDRFLQNASDGAQVAHAQLLKAETLFAAHDYPDAAVAYKAAQTSNLPEQLFANALYKQAWSLAQAKDYHDAIATYSNFLSTFPKHELASKAILQRGMAYQHTGNLETAIHDFDRVINDYSDNSTRELAMLQKALIFGTQHKNEEMRQAFKILLSSYPKTEAAAQAEFWIGWSLFEEARYQDALVHLLNARKLDPKRYGERSSLRILLANYYLEDLAKTIKEAKALPEKNVPPEIYEWIASKSLEAKDYSQAEYYLDRFINNRTIETPSPDRFLELAEARVKLGKYQAALPPIDRYLEYARTPAKRAQGLLVKAEAALGSRQFDTASKLAEEALLLQPEGLLNAKGRLLNGRILGAQGQHDQAAKTFMAVAVLYDDSEITPNALKMAADAYKKANNLVESRNALSELERRFPRAESKIEHTKEDTL